MSSFAILVTTVPNPIRFKPNPQTRFFKLIISTQPKFPSKSKSKCQMTPKFIDQRLLRNRVSAQQARERKKAYLTDLEARVKELETKNAELEERLSTLQNENQMLRHILKNTTAGAQEGRKEK